MFSSNTSQADGGYQISRSLRFNSVDGTSLDRTPSSSTNRQAFTISFWCKNASTAGAITTFYAAGSDTNNNETVIGYWDGLYVQNVLAGAQWRIRTNAVYRDPSAWYHFVFAFDLGNGTQANRLKIYVNGVESTYSAADGNPLPSTANSMVDANVVQYIGRRAYSATGQTTNAYMAEFYLIDGQALTPSSFGQTNAQTGVWEPKAYSGSYGTNGFYVNFSDNSNTTAATLGKDYSGNGNNWTPNNFSVAAGAGNDSLVDVPTPYGIDTGAGGTVRGNYCTWNSVLQTNDAANTYTNGNLEVSATSSNWANGTISTNTGSYYFELTPSAGASGLYLGINNTKTDVRITAYSGGIEASPGGGSNQGSLASWSNGDIIGVAVNGVSKTVQFYRNGSTYGSQVTYTTALDLFPFARNGSISSSTVIMNAGQRPFAYTAPSGFQALCTQNLPTPTIGATAATQANKYFNTVTWTGNGASSRAITGVGFQPDLVWDKMRSDAYQHAIVDGVRGGNKVLHSNSTAAEDVNWQYGYVSSFNSDGFTIQAGSSSAENWNLNGATFVAWNWNAGGSNVTNTSGSITSTVRANTTSRFSIATFTGNGTAGATVGHGLGVAPSMIIVKSMGNARNWLVYHSAIGATKFLQLDTTIAATTAATPWNDTAPTSTVFTLGTSAAGNESGVTRVAYCFAEVAGYSKFGSYTGNGSADGPFVYTGFRPAYVMAKKSSGIELWFILDAKRGTYNVNKPRLNANNVDAESSAYSIMDFTSNGFKLRDADTSWNANGDTYIFAAFAESPFKYSLAR